VTFALVLALLFGAGGWSVRRRWQRPGDPSAREGE
jgi:hypothetical protein